MELEVDHDNLALEERVHAQSRRIAKLEDDVRYLYDHLHKAELARKGCIAQK